MGWGIEETWREASALVAQVYGAPVELVRVSTRGRGPRPPKAVWEPRKIALYLVQSIAEPNCVPIAGALGMHRDTVWSAVNEVRARVDGDDSFDALMGEFERVLLARLNLSVAEGDLVARRQGRAA